MSFLTPHALTIKELLTREDAYYQIPDYQRPYKWTDKQLEKLWEDISEASKHKSQENYFLGPIITAVTENDSAKKGGPDYKGVIDGQQRLTTLAILCCAVREKYPSINSEDINEAIAHGKDERIRFLTHKRAQTDFETHVTDRGAFDKLEKPKKSALKTDEPKHKFVNSALFFIKKLDELKKERAEKFINFLFNKVEVIRIDCLSLTSAMKIFQVINSTGIDLTNSDLVKSLLLREVVRRHEGDKSVLDSKREQFADDWKSMEKDAEACASNMNDMLSVYEYCTLARPSGKGMYEKLTAFFDEKDHSKIADELKNLFGEQDPNEISKKLKNFFGVCREKIYEKEDTLLYSFRYLPWSMLWKSVILAVIQNRPNDLPALAEALRRFYYTYWIGGKTLSWVKPTSFDIIEMAKDKTNSIEDIKKVMQRQMKDDKIAAVAQKNLASSDIAGDPWCKPLLLLMEYAVADDSKLSFIEMDNKLHLEHVLPVEYKGKEGWEHIHKKTATKYLHSAGNLTLLSGKKNIAASNFSFEKKIGVYEGYGRDGKQNQRMTAFQITQKIITDYGKQWNEDSMRDRRQWFLKEAENILEIGINSEKD